MEGKTTVFPPSSTTSLSSLFSLSREASHRRVKQGEGEGEKQAVVDEDDGYSVDWAELEALSVKIQYCLTAVCTPSRTCDHMTGAILISLSQCHSILSYCVYRRSLMSTK